MRRLRVIVALIIVPLVMSCRPLQETQSELNNDTAEPTPQMTPPEPSPAFVTGEVIYVPAYSNVFHETPKPYPLTTTLNVHNIDLDNSIHLTRVDYYNTSGELLKSYLEEDMEVQPLQTVQFVVNEAYMDEITGANFIVEWVSEAQVNSPIVEALMISTRKQQGISFLAEGRVIRILGNDN